MFAPVPKQVVKLRSLFSFSTSFEGEQDGGTATSKQVLCHVAGLGWRIRSTMCKYVFNFLFIFHGVSEIGAGIHAPSNHDLLWNKPSFEHPLPGGIAMNVRRGLWLPNSVLALRGGGSSSRIGEELCTHGVRVEQKHEQQILGHDVDFHAASLDKSEPPKVQQDAYGPHGKR